MGSGYSAGTPVHPESYPRQRERAGFECRLGDLYLAPT